MSSRMGRIVPLLVAGFVGIQSGIYIFQPTLDQYYSEMKEAKNIGDKLQTQNDNNDSNKNISIVQKQEDIKSANNNNTVVEAKQNTIINQKQEEKSI